MKKVIYAQFFVLFIGVVFSWTNFINELFSWLNNQPCETGCSASGALVNPFLTPCFYGAIFFTLAFLLSLVMLFLGRDKKSDDVEMVEKEISEPVEEEEETTE